MEAEGVEGMFVLGKDHEHVGLYPPTIIVEENLE